MNNFNEHEQDGAPAQPAAGALPFLPSDEEEQDDHYFASEEALAMRSVVDHSFMDSDDAMDCLAPFETDTWRAVDTMPPSDQVHMGFDQVVEMPSQYLNQVAPAKQFGALPDASIMSMPSGVDSLPLPPLPALSVSVFGGDGAAPAASTPQAYCPPSVTCWTAFESSDADETVEMLEKFINAKGAQLTCRNYTLNIVDGDMRAVIHTCARGGGFTTMCRRLSGDSVLFNALFHELLANVNGKPTVCYPAGCKDAFMQAADMNAASSTTQVV